MYWLTRDSLLGFCLVCSNAMTSSVLVSLVLVTSTLAGEVLDGWVLVGVHISSERDEARKLLLITVKMKQKHSEN